MSAPLIAPTNAPMASRIGTETAPPSPWGTRTATRMTFVRLSTGPTDRSSPPVRTDGAVAIAMIAKGARSASVSGSADPETKLAWTMRFATNSATARIRANMNDRVCSSASARSRMAITLSAEEARDEPLAGQLVPVELGEDRPFPEDEDTVHELDELVDLGGEHHDRDALGREPGQQPVEVALGVEIDAARRVVEEQDRGLRRQPARHDDLLLVAAAERRDRQPGRAERDRQLLLEARQAAVGARAGQQPRALVGRERRGREVLPDGQGGEQRLRAAIARDVDDAEVRGLRRRAD